MKIIHLETLKQRVIERYDPDYLVDVLGITARTLVDSFEDELLTAFEEGEFPEFEDNDEEDTSYKEGK